MRIYKAERRSWVEISNNHKQLATSFRNRISDLPELSDDFYDLLWANQINCVPYFYLYFI